MQIHDIKAIKTRRNKMSCCGLPVSTRPLQGPRSAPSRASWHTHLYRVVVRSPLRPPEGYICYNTNIIQATNEFLKSAIKRETTAATDIALALTYLSSLLHKQQSKLLFSFHQIFH